MRKGFKTLHTMEAFNNATHENYMGVGLHFHNGQYASSINVHWSVWQHRLQLGSRWAWSFCSTLLTLCSYVIWWMQLPFGWKLWKSLWFLMHSWFVGSLLHKFILLIIMSRCGSKLQGCWREAWFVSLQTSRGKGHSFTVILLTSLHLSSLGFHGWH